jgi:uncharacterized membrane protein
MARIEESIDLDVPVETANNQWAQFEELPAFMEGIEQVRRLDDEQRNSESGAWRGEVENQNE